VTSSHSLIPPSVRTDLTEVGANSTLSVAKINKFDSGKMKRRDQASEDAIMNVLSFSHLPFR
jgi:hypothetical protein